MAVTARSFLEAYRSYEAAVRCACGMECREYEETLKGDIRAERLRFCRTVRNYLSHADDKGFVGISEAMIKTLTRETDMLLGRGDVARKRAKSTLLMSEKDRVDDAVRAMAKAGAAWCAVEDGPNWRVVSLAEAAIAALESKRTPLGMVGGCKRAISCDAHDDVAELDPNKHYVVYNADGVAIGELVR